MREWISRWRWPTIEPRRFERSGQFHSSAFFRCSGVSTESSSWYQGRTVHIHFKVRSAASATSAYEFTSQFFFDDIVTDQVYAAEPYASKGTRTLRNSGDGIYNQGGSQLVLDVSKTSDGYAATFDIALEGV